MAPIVIHSTFQRDSGTGKKARMREFGVWHMDPPSYYCGGGNMGSSGGSSSGSGSSTSTSSSSSSGGGGSSRENGKVEASSRSGGGGGDSLWLLTYENGAPQFVAGVEQQRYGGPGRMPMFEKHWLGMSYQLMAFRWVGGWAGRRVGGPGRMPMFEKHWLGMSYQLMAFRWAGGWAGRRVGCGAAQTGARQPSQCSQHRARESAVAGQLAPEHPCPACLPARRDALAAARMLGRVLALPTLLCWCDFDEHPHILVACRIK